MQFKTMILCTALTGALMVPALAKAEDHTAAAVEAAKAAEPVKTEDAAKEAPKADVKAEKGEHKGHKMFEDADSNKDGKLSKEEFLARHEKKFGEIDANKDGSLTPDEMKAHGEARREKFKERKNAE
jgi:hypothetical protein